MMLENWQSKSNTVTGGSSAGGASNFIGFFVLIPHTYNVQSASLGESKLFLWLWAVVVRMPCNGTLNGERIWCLVCLCMVSFMIFSERKYWKRVTFWYSYCCSAVLLVFSVRLLLIPSHSCEQSFGLTEMEKLDYFVVERQGWREEEFWERNEVLVTSTNVTVACAADCSLALALSLLLVLVLAFDIFMRINNSSGGGGGGGSGMGEREMKWCG